MGCLFHARPAGSADWRLTSHAGPTRGIPSSLPRSDLRPSRRDLDDIRDPVARETNEILRLFQEIAPVVLDPKIGDADLPMDSRDRDLADGGHCPDIEDIRVFNPQLLPVHTWQIFLARNTRWAGD